MKILLAPSKTRNYKTCLIEKALTEPIFKQEADFLFAEIKKYSKEEIAKIMKIKNPLLDQTFEEYQMFEVATQHPAIYSYTGMVFKELEVMTYDDDQQRYLESNLRILSAMYGVLKPYDGVKYYRLDMKMKVLEMSSYKFWKNKINAKILEDELIVNLSSTEFSKMVDCPIVNIEFKEKISQNTYKNVGVYSKMARGKMANYMIKNQIESLEGIFEFDLVGYAYNKLLSTDQNIVFTR